MKRLSTGIKDIKLEQQAQTEDTKAFKGEMKMKSNEGKDS